MLAILVCHKSWMPIYMSWWKAFSYRRIFLEKILDADMLNSLVKANILHLKITLHILTL